VTANAGEAVMRSSRNENTELFVIPRGTKRFVIRRRTERFVIPRRHDEGSGIEQSEARSLSAAGGSG
jgi:hypothetical protein